MSLGGSYRPPPASLRRERRLGAAQAAREGEARVGLDEIEELGRARHRTDRAGAPGGISGCRTRRSGMRSMRALPLMPDNAPSPAWCHDRACGPSVLPGTAIALVGGPCTGQLATSGHVEGTPMRLPRRRFLHLVAGAAALPVLSRRANAQAYPNRPITLIVPFAVGGPTDIAARIVTPRMGELLGQPIIIENIGGAGGMTGTARVAKATPDGYVLGIGHSGTHAYNQTLYKKPLYNAATDFAPVGLTNTGQKVLVTRKDLPAATMREFATYAKANQRAMQFGSGGPGSTSHISCVLLNSVLGVDVTHVPYRGSGPAMQDLLGGRFDYMCDSVPTVLPQIRQGALKAIALLSPTRASVLPDVPTAREQGFDGLEMDLWQGFFLPRGTPDAIVRRLNKALSDALDTPSVRDRFETLGIGIPPPEHRSPEYLAKLVASEIEKWAVPIKASGVVMH